MPLMKCMYSQRYLAKCVSDHVTVLFLETAISKYFSKQDEHCYRVANIHVIYIKYILPNAMVAFG